jgi:hypothetical protein
VKVAFGGYWLAVLMSYHAAAVAMPWSQVPANFQVFILGMMKALGGTYLALAIVLGVILIVPFRQGAAWPLWTGLNG